MVYACTRLPDVTVPNTLVTNIKIAVPLSRDFRPLYKSVDMLKCVCRTRCKLVISCKQCACLRAVRVPVDNIVRVPMKGTRCQRVMSCKYCACLRTSTCTCKHLEGHPVDVQFWHLIRLFSIPWFTVTMSHEILQLRLVLFNVSLVSIYSLCKAV